MLRTFFIICFLLSFINNAVYSADFTVNSITNSLPSVHITQPAVQEPINQPLQPIIKSAVKKNTPPKKAFKVKGAGMTNYEYDDSYYMYNKYESFIKDNIDYSKKNRRKVY